MLLFGNIAWRRLQFIGVAPLIFILEFLLRLVCVYTRLCLCRCTRMCRPENHLQELFTSDHFLFETRFFTGLGSTRSQ